jgi:nucleotide sugar dehydrogenase
LKVCVVGLGKIGLPLAVQIGSKGHSVVGADISPDVVALVGKAVPPFPGETDLEPRLAQVVRDGLLSATIDTATAVSDSDAVIVVVPLVVDAQGQPEYRAMDAATADIARGLRAGRGTLVSYETTLPVTTTRQRFVPALERDSGLTAGVDFLVCHSPERVFSGRIFEDLRRYPKLVGGIDEASAQRAVELYEAVLDFDDRPDLSRPNGVWDLGSAEAAELAKLAETTYRDVNIALANEFARFADMAGIDVYKVIDAANSQPYSHVHRPGIAVGGHCIPVYPRFFLANDPSARLPATARQVNDSMPAYAVDLLGDLAGDLSGRTVVVLGAAYRGGVKETAFSGVFGTVEALQAVGAVPLVHDPLYEDDELESLGLTPYHLGEPCDAAILQAEHAEYLELGPRDLPGVRGIVDGRHVLLAERWPGVRVVAVGARTTPRA